MDQALGILADPSIRQKPAAGAKAMFIKLLDRFHNSLYRL